MPTADDSKKNMSEKPPAPSSSKVPTWIDPRSIPAKSRFASRKLCQYFGI